jgi:hypothetical protein
MEQIASYRRPALLKDHPPIIRRIVLSSTGTEIVLLIGAVIGHQPPVAAGDNNNPPAVPESVGAWTPGCDRVVGVLADDVTIPVSGGVSATVYVHADLNPDELLFAEGITAEQEKQAIAAMRGVGLFA